MSNMNPIKYLTIHTSATFPSMDINVDTIKQWHLDRGWSDVGYHFFIKRDGTVQDGRRPLTRMGAQVLNHNAHNLGICMAGGLREGTEKPEDNYTTAQYRSLIELLTELHSEHPDAIIMGHNGFNGHESRGCPCFDWKSFRDYLSSAWNAPYKPSDWMENDWKNGVPSEWHEISWYNEVDKQL